MKALNYACQYTDQIRKKRKIWHDGKLRYYSSLNKFQLFSSEGGIMLASDFVTNTKQVAQILNKNSFGEEHQIFSSYLVVLEEQLRDVEVHNCPNIRSQYSKHSQTLSQVQTIAVLTQISGTKVSYDYSYYICPVEYSWVLPVLLILFPTDAVSSIMTEGESYNVQSQGNQLQIESFGLKRPLRSCSRCRRNKTKCDSISTRPNPCTLCAKKNVICELEYVVPTQRSRELNSLYKNVEYLRCKLDELVQSCGLLLDCCQSFDEVSEIRADLKSVE